MLEEYGMVKNTLQLLNRAPKATRETWDKLGISPRGIDREVVDCMHRIQMGVGADYVNILLQGLRCSLSDGWGGSMIGNRYFRCPFRHADHQIIADQSRGA